MADIPLKSDDEMTNDLVGAVENIAQSVKAGSRDFTKSFNGLTTAIKKLQTTLVNAIKAIKVQVISKPEKAVKQPSKVKETSTKELVKEKETKTEVVSEKKSKSPKSEVKKELDTSPIEVVVQPQTVEIAKEKKQEEVAAEKQQPINKNVVDAEAMILKALSGNLNSFWKKLREFSSKTNDNDSVGKALNNLLQQGKIKRDADAPSLYKLVENVKESKAPEIKSPEIKSPEIKSPEIKSPEIKSPEIKSPEIKSPEIKAPEIKAPEIKSPEIKAPEIKAPEIKSPEIKVPDVAEKKEPKQKIPKASSQPKIVDPIVEAEKQKAKNQKQEDADVRSQKLRDQAKIIALRLEESLKPKPVKESKPSKEPKKAVDPQEKERVIKEKAREKEIEKRQEKVKPVKISSLIEGINNTGDAWSKMISGIRKSIVDAENARKAEENKVAKSGKEGAKEFVGPPKKLFDKNEIKASDAAEKEKDDESERREKADREASSAEKALRTYFRKKEENQANEEQKAANDLVKQQEQAARNLEQANQKAQKELDNLIGAFQRLTPLFKGPLVNFGLKMIAKGIGYKQPKEMSKGGDVSYLADGGDASGTMKPKGTDTQPAMLTPGEFVVNKSAAQDPENRKQLESINSGEYKKKTEYHSSGGSVGGVGYYAAGGAVAASSGIAIAAIGTAINSVTKSFAIASEAVSSFANAVQKANPALMEQVGLAMDDLQAVIGRALTPAITMIIPLIRQFADYVDYSAKKFAPAVESFVKIIKELLKPLLELGATITNALMPSVKLSVLMFGGMVKILIPIIDLFSSLFETVTLLMGSLGDSEFLFSVFNNSIEILSRAVSIVAGTIQLVIGAFVVGVAKMIEVLGTMVDYIPFSGDAGKSIEGFGERVGKVGEKLYNKSLENFKAIGEGKPRRFRAGEMSGDKGIEKNSSYGAAVRQVQSVSIVGIGDEMRKNALMAGLGQKTQEESLNQIEKNTGELVDLFKDLKSPQGTGAGKIVGPNPYAPATVNENLGAVPGTVGTRYGTITPIN